MRFDDEARAKVPCDLVVGEPVAMARTGNWMNANGARSDWRKRIAVTRMAANLAPDVLATSGLTTEKALAPLFTDGWRRDYRLPVVCAIRDICMARLRRE
ncbi:hypothetical protein J8I87_39545 [Paraburkholderia sp. LEh10]|uniref:hypothetical protein n=1 Tax=Paraburkholderia sp. LEh10 TaxID=2821353 RepID=UPI001AE6EEDB|nr:hypothetical protein [Paraburkholderia sp. LEh10]MBP0595635.1 hypothetical protein [Paraburkholderia sp. LEh10]